ncbi:MAG: response regulator, partial [Deltaproteobacteria bacterium]|nr:response regulator [Candidatus Tharpella sp.]
GKIDQVISFQSLNEHLYLAQTEKKPYTMIIADLSQQKEPCNLKDNLPKILHPQFMVALTATDTTPPEGYDTTIPLPIKRSLFYEQLARCIGRELADAKTVETAQSKYEFEKKRQQLRVLLVDDNQVNIKVGSKMLAKLGISCTTASNGLEALAALGAAYYDVVFMDIQMPEMDGYETTKQIRSRTTTTINPRITIIAMTAHAAKSDKDRCLAAGMNDFLTKPVRLEQLNEVLSRAMDNLKASPPPVDKDDIICENDFMGDDFMEDDAEFEDFSQGDKNSSVGNTQLFDRKTFLAKLDDDLELYRELLNDYRESSLSYLEDIENGVKEKDFAKISIAAHSIKGSSGSIEAHQMHAAAYELEKAAKQENLELINEARETMETEFEILREIIKDEMAAKE